jgi:KUP system potassium uptake protein
MPVWQDKLFIALAGAADSATDYFHIPAERVVEIGAQVTI